MKVRDDEERSAKSLEDFLKLRGCLVQRQPVQKDPPDLCFDVTPPSKLTERWGIEVTALTQYLDWQGEEKERRIFGPALHRLVDRINSEHGATMTGSYALFVTPPLEKSVFRGLETRILAYI